MSTSAGYLRPSEIARRIGVSVKALRLYERHGLIAPLRTAAGWRAYGPDQLARAAKIAELRRLGLGLASPEVRARTEGVIAWRPGAEMA